jgi:hypothetical protein
LKKQVVHVLIVTDDNISAQCMVRLMHLAWKRDGSAHKRSGLTVEWNIAENALDEFLLPGTDAYTNFSEPTVNGEMTNYWLSKKERTGRLHLIANGRSPGIRLLRGSSLVEFELRVRMVPAHFFPDPEVNAAKVVELLTKRVPETDPAPTDFVVLGVTDASLERKALREIGSGVDQILTPGLLAQIAADLPAEPRVGVAITGLERDFVEFDGAAPRWSKYQNARDAASDPNLIKFMLRQIVLDRPHLRTMMENDHSFRPYVTRPIVITAVMPCGFLRGWNCINYNPFDPGWIHGSPAIRGERDALYLEPYGCADPLLTALTGLQTEFQITRDDMPRMTTRQRQRSGSPPQARRWQR